MVTQFTCVDSTTVEYNQPGARKLDRDNVALLVKLVPKSEGRRSEKKKKLVVATTHLLFNLKRVDVKLAQAVVLLAGKFA